MMFQENVPEEEIDFTELIIHDMYDVLTMNDDPYPDTYTDEMKLEFIDKLLSYLLDKDEYEMCATLQGMKRDIKNEYVNTNKKSRRVK